MSGVPIYPPGTNGPGARPPYYVQKNTQKNTKEIITKKSDNITKEQEKKEKEQKENEQNKKNKGKEILKKISDSLEGSSQPQQRMKKLPISINTSASMLQSTPPYGKRKLIETPVTPSILSRLSGALSGVQNELISKFGKSRNNITCEHCTNIGCISITSLRHDSDSDEEDEMDDQPYLEFQCTICHREQSIMHMNQALGVTAKKLKTVAPSPSTSTPLPGTPASMVSPQDAAYSEKYMQLKTSITCMECEAQGSLVKFGFTKATPPRPRFKCNKCGYLFSINHVIQMMSNLSTLPQQQQQQQTESNQDCVLDQDIAPLSPLSVQEDVIIHDAQPSPTSPVDFSPSINSLPILLEETPPPPSSSHPDVISFLLDSVKQLTTQAAANQKKFDYITTLIEQNKQLELDLQNQKNQNKLQRKEIENLKKMLQEKDKNNHMNTTKNNEQKNTQKNTENNIENTMTYTNLGTDSFPPLIASTYVQQAKKPATPKIKYAPGQFRSHKPTSENLELASKIFNDTQLPPTADYKYLYFPSNKRMKPSIIRQKLTLLGIDNVRILDAHCPDWNVIALLIHSNYEAELLTKFTAARVNPVQYDYLDPIHLRDQRWSTFATEEKVTKLKTIFKNNLMRSLSFMRYPTCHSVAKYFYRKELLTLEELQSFLNNSKQQQIANAFPPNADHQQLTTPASLSPQEAIQSPSAASDTPTQL
jgi:hypothetical protein